jgi:hypothetical protein
VKPTQAAGMPVYWVRKTDGETEFAAIPQGKLEMFQSWLEGCAPEVLQHSFETPTAMLACLRSTPAALETLTRNLSVEAWGKAPAEGEWNLTEVICHLRDVEREVNLPRLQKVLSEDNPFLPGAVTDVWVKERNSAREDGRQALMEYTAARKEVLSVLEPADWQRPARHAIFGPTTMRELVSIMAGHDRAHVQQVWKTMGNSAIS